MASGAGGEGAARERRHLTDALVDLGASEEEVAEAERHGTVTDLITDLGLWHDRRRLTVAELAAEAGVSEEIARRSRLNLGLPDPGSEAACRPAEVALIEAFSTAVSLFGEAPVQRFTRALGVATGAVAEAAFSVFASEVAVPLLERDSEGDRGHPYAQAVLDAMRAFAGVSAAMDVALRLHFQAAVGRLGPITVKDTELAVGFVDLVGSTALGSSLGAEGVAGAMAELDEFATDAAGRHGVRLVKLLGDGAMYVARSVEAVAAACRSFLGDVEASPRLGQARGALAFGPVAARDGDYFGPVVNVAARLAELADPGEVVCDERAAGVLTTALTGAEQVVLKGFSEPVTFRRLVRGHR